MPTQTDLDSRTEQSPYAEQRYDLPVDVGTLAPLPTSDRNASR